MTWMNAVSIRQLPLDAAARRRLLAMVVLACGGCSSLNGSALAPDVNASTGHDRRKEAMIREFDARRNAVQIQAAEAALDRGDYRESEQTLRAVLQRDGSHRDARLLLAEVLLLTGRHPEAFTQVEHALRDHPADPRVQHAMAVLLDASGRPEEARTFYDRAAELSPEFQQYASAHAAATAEDAPAGGWADASQPSVVSSLGPPPEIDRAEPAGWDIAVPAAPTGASAKGGTAPHIGPEPGAMLHAGLRALVEGDVDAARSQFAAATSADPQNPHIPVHAAVTALEHNQPRLAVEVLRPAAERFPETASVHRTLGAAYYRSGDYASAQTALRRALSLDNSNGLSYLLMGYTLEKLGQPSAATQQFERAAAVRPRTGSVQR